MDYLYSKFVEEQKKVIDEVILMKFRDLESKLDRRIHGTFLARLERFNREGYNHNTLERFLFDVGKLGYTISQDYLPNYSTSKLEGDKIIGTIDHTKIQLTVTYKVISV